MEKRVIVTNPVIGLLYMQVCAHKEATEEEVLSVCNSENPCGTQNGWVHIEREGNKAPIQCSDDPNRIHYLISC